MVHREHDLTVQSDLACWRTPNKPREEKDLLCIRTFQIASWVCELDSEGSRFRYIHSTFRPCRQAYQTGKQAGLAVDSAEETKSGIGSALAMRVRVVFRVADGTHAYLAWCDDQANLGRFETTTAHGSAFVLRTIRAGAGPLDLSNGFQERHHEQVVRSLAERSQ